MRVNFQKWKNKKISVAICLLVLSVCVAIPVALYWVLIFHLEIQFVLLFILHIAAPIALFSSVKLSYHLICYLLLLNNEIEISCQGVNIQSKEGRKFYKWAEIKELKMVYFGFFYCATDKRNDFIFVISRASENFESILNQTAEHRSA